jgi:hypothetical protein
MICFFCGRHLKTYAKLSEHLLTMHLGAEVTGAMFMLDVGIYDANKVICWCGNTVVKKGPAIYETLAQHLKNRGGLEAHLLEIALGNQ